MTAAIPTLEELSGYTDEQIDELEAKAAREDPACFAAYVLRDEETNGPINIAQHQVDWHDLMSKHNRLLIWSSIESGKTQHVSVARILWEIGRNPRIRIVILSASRGLAQKISRTLRRYIENSVELHRVFPDLRPGKVWNEYSFTVAGIGFAKDPTVQVLGLHGKILGSRTDLLIIDDVLDMDNCATPDLRQKTTTWVKNTPMGRMKELGRIWVVGTAFHREDFLHHLAGMRSFTAYRYPVVVKLANGTLESRWPSAWPMRRINQWREDHGELEFARQLMCEARSDDDSRFRQEWLDWAKAAGRGKRIEYMLTEVPIGYRVFTGVDLGVQQHAKADPTCLSTIVVHPDAKREILCIESGRWTGPEILTRIADAQRRYKGIIIVENNQGQDFIRQFAAAQGLHTLAVTTGKQKLHPELGIEGLAVELQRKQWIIPSDKFGRCEPEIEKLMGEMLWYDPAKHTGDRLMATWIAREGIRLTAAPLITAQVGQLRLLQR